MATKYKLCWKRVATRTQLGVPREHDFKCSKMKTCANVDKEHLNKNSAFWNTAISASESKFNVFGSDGANVWRMPNTYLDAKKLKTTVKYGEGSVMVYACMSEAGTRKLKFIKTTLRFVTLIFKNQILKYVGNCEYKRRETLNLSINLTLWQRWLRNGLKLSQNASKNWI